MYPIQCPGGYPVPVKAGRFDITGFCVTVADPASNSQFAIVDDSAIKETDTLGNLLTTLDSKKVVLANLKGLANIDTVLSYDFSEPIKTRYGISIYGNNWVAGSVCVYRR